MRYKWHPKTFAFTFLVYTIFANSGCGRLWNSISYPDGGLAPNQISGLSAWYKADAITGVVNGANVTSWVDSSISGNSLGASTQAPPFLETNAVNGLPAVNFGGSNSLSMANPAHLSTGDEPWSMFAVLKRALGSDTTGFPVVFSYGTCATSEGIVLFYCPGGAFCAGTNNVGGTGGSSTNTDQSFFIVVVTYTGSAGTITFYENGKLSLASSQAAYNVGTTAIVLGDVQDTTVGQNFSGLVAEAGVYNRILTSFERQELELQLSLKYSIPVQLQP